MVVLNFTLIVELGLFLIFLWGCHVMIFKPVLRELDNRQAKIDGDTSQASREQAEAVNLEQEYNRQIATVRRAVSDEFRKAREAAQHEQDARVAEVKKQVEEEVAAVRRVADEAVAKQRQEYDRLAPEIATELARMLGLGDYS